MSSRFPSRSNKPKAVSGLLDSALRHFRLSKKLERYEAFPHWPEVVGEEIASVTVPEKILRRKVLVVRVLDASWAQELSLQKAQILRDINRLALGASIEDIRFVTGDPRTISEKQT